MHFSSTRMMWSAGVVAALGSLTYPAISAFVSLYASPESQGKVFPYIYSDSMPSDTSYPSQALYRACSRA